VMTVDTVAPGVPVAVSPLAGSVVLTVVPKLSVGVVSGAVSYQYQWNITNDFSTPLGTSPWTGTAYTLTAGQALPFGDIYWRAQAKDAAGNESGWSAGKVMKVTILKTPGDGSYTTAVKPVFSWAGVGGVLEYKLQVDDDAGFASPVIDMTRPPSTSYTPAIPLAYGKYYWRMQVRTATGWGNWTPVYAFTVTTALPVAPVLVSPVAGLITNDDTPTFSWNAVTGITNYEIQIDHANTFVLPVEDTAVVGVTNYTPAHLVDGVHYWRVRSVNGYGIGGAWSAVRVMTVDTVAPGVPVAVSPANYSVVVIVPTYSWLPSATANAYQFQYDRDSDCATPDYVSPLLGTTSHKPTSQPKGLFYWCVKARDAAGNWSAFSSPFRMLIGSPMPAL
jgi:hypothetical protein